MTRGLTDGEHIRIYHGNIYYDNPDGLFSERPKKYPNNYTLYLCENGQQLGSGISSGTVYLAPDYIIEIAGTDYLLSQAPSFEVINTGNGDGRYNYKAYIPVFEIEVDNPDTVVPKIKTADGQDVSPNDAFYSINNRILSVKYKGFEYFPDICIIRLKQRQ